jgi:beta-ureidopropionase / N-carbamoyl-L-amino-acid hydrolase
MSSHDVSNAADAAASAVRAQDAVDSRRLNAAVSELAAFGGRSDGGVSRETLTPLEVEARRHLIERARALGCRVSVDTCGNLFFRRAGQQNDLPPVLTGSHIDTQPIGGKFDGAYGVLAGLEVIHALNDAGIATRRPVEVVAWTNEEGSRFGPGTMGSSAFALPERLAGYRESRDADGVAFGDALDAALAATPDVDRIKLGHAIDSCVELHIEQGPVLEGAGVPLGVVTGIQSVRWFNVTVTGAAAHAGTTPMDVRRDAMRAALELAGRLFACADSARARGLRMTIGRWRVAPNSINTIPGEVEFTIDVRCVDEGAIAEFEDALRAAVTGLDAADGFTAQVRNLFTRATTHFPAQMIDLVERGCARAATNAGAGMPIHVTSGAFHDAMYVADLCPTAMIFVPSRGGISHNAAEHTEPHELHLGAQALAYVVTELANR